MLGETAAAAEAYQNAMAIFERYPKEPDAQLEVANTYNLMGLVHADENQQVKAEQSYRSAIVQLQPIVEADPDQFAFSCALGDVFHNLGALQRQAGDLGAAASSFTGSDRSIRPVAKSKPGPKRICDRARQVATGVGPDLTQAR